MTCKLFICLIYLLHLFRWINSKEQALRDVLKAKSENTNSRAEWSAHGLFMFATEEEFKALKECIAQYGIDEEAEKEKSRGKRRGSRSQSSLSPDH